MAMASDSISEEEMINIALKEFIKNSKMSEFNYYIKVDGIIKPFKKECGKLFMNDKFY